MPVKSYNLQLKGHVGGPAFDSDKVDRTLALLERNRVAVLINSTGGSLATGLSICAAFRNHAAVDVHFVGLNASAATIASLGASHISMDAGAMYLIHQCSTSFMKIEQMNASQFETMIQECRQTMEDLDKLDRCIASMYAVRCNKPADKLLDLMKKGGWLSAKEALDWGFIDEITDFPEDKSAFLDESTISAMIDCGMPVPVIDPQDQETTAASGPVASIPPTEQTTRQEQTTEDSRNLFARVLDSAISFFSGSAAKGVESSDGITPPTTHDLNSDSSLINPSLMNKNFLAIAMALGLADGLSLSPQADGSLSLDAAQADALEASLTTSQNRISELEAEIADLKAKLDEQDKQPAQTGSQVVSSQTQAEQAPPSSDAERFCKAHNAARQLFNLV